MLDHGTFDVVGRWQRGRGPQHVSYAAWRHLRHHTFVTGDWGPPTMLENGLVPEQLLDQEYGHAGHAEEADLPPALLPFGAVPPLVTDISPSVGDRWLDVCCWRTGELEQYDVSGPAHPGRPARPARALWPAGCSARRRRGSVRPAARRWSRPAVTGHGCT